MIDVHVTLAVDALLVQPAARFWVDTDSGDALGTEVEVRMQRLGSNRFCGSFARELLQGQEQFLYRVALLAPPSGQWALTIRDRDTGVALLDDGDDLVLTKTWLTGTCALAAESRPAMYTELQAVGDAWRTSVPATTPSNVVRLSSYRRR